jgi:O-antigen chain-terminating methyltransferase
MLKFCYEVLNTDNYLILETINIQSLITFTSSVYCDPTHVKPIHPETLIFLLESVGFKNIEIVHSGDVPDHIKLQLIDPKNENEETYNNNINKLNNILFGPQDYAVIAKK